MLILKVYSSICLSCECTPHTHGISLYWGLGPQGLCPALQVSRRSRTRAGVSSDLTALWPPYWTSREVCHKAKVKSETSQGPSNRRAWPGWAVLGRVFRWLELPKENNFHIIRGATLARSSLLFPAIPQNNLERPEVLATWSQPSGPSDTWGQRTIVVQGTALEPRGPEDWPFQKRLLKLVEGTIVLRASSPNF